jgi:hypothetical protein
MPLSFEHINDIINKLRNCGNDHPFADNQEPRLDSHVWLMVARCA